MMLLVCAFPALVSAATFELRSTLPQGSALLEGDTVEIELYMKNPIAEEVASFQATMHYDTEVLDFISTEINEEVFSVVLPEERKTGSITMGAGTLSTPIKTTEVLLATLTFEVTAVTKAKTTIELRNELENGIFVMEEAFPKNIWEKTSLPTLTLTLGEFIPPTGITTITDTPLVVDEEEEEVLTPITTTPVVVEPTVPTPLHNSAPLAPTLSAPVGIRYHTQGNTVRLTWDAVPGASGYYVYYSGHRDTFLHRRQVTSTELSFGQLEPGSEQFYVISALQGTTEGVRSVLVPVRVGTMEILNETVPVVEAPLKESAPAVESLHKVTHMPSTGLPLALVLLGTGMGSAVLILARKNA